MKRILLTTALTLALTGTAAFAQQATAPQDTPNANAPYHHHHHFHPNPQREAAFIGQKLNLSADTTAKLEPIFASRDQQFEALRQNTSLTPDQRHEQMRSIFQSTQQQLASVLTPDQLQQLKAMHRGHHRHFGPNGQSPDQQPLPAPPSGV